MYLLGVKLDVYILAEALGIIEKWLDDKTSHQIITLNSEFIVAAQKDQEFKSVINTASLVLADTVGVLWATKYLSLKLSNCKVVRYPQIIFQAIYTLFSLIFFPKYCASVVERLPGVDLLLDMAKLCASKGSSMFLLGSYNKSGELTATKLSNLYPELKIVGIYEGSSKKGCDLELTQMINQKQPDVLVVAFDHIEQNKWIARNLKNLPTVKLAIGVGGSLDFISGNIQRAPIILRKIGLEWLFRLIRQPRRLKRIFNATIVFIILVITFKIKNQNFIKG